MVNYHCSLFTIQMAKIMAVDHVQNISDTPIAWGVEPLSPLHQCRSLWCRGQCWSLAMGARVSHLRKLGKLYRPFRHFPMSFRCVYEWIICGCIETSGSWAMLTLRGCIMLHHVPMQSMRFTTLHTYIHIWIYIYTLICNTANLHLGIPFQHACIDTYRNKSDR